MFVASQYGTPQASRILRRFKIFGKTCSPQHNSLCSKAPPVAPSVGPGATRTFWSTTPAGFFGERYDVHFSPPPYLQTAQPASAFQNLV
jgi:hypothetical protein